MSERLHGLLAEFESADALLAAVHAATGEGYRRLDAYSPFPVEGLAEAIGFRADRLPWIILAGTLLGALIGYGMQWYSAVIDYPFNSGGRPLHAWPAFIVITFELAVLGGAFAAFIGMIVLNGLPRLHHPVFNTRAFQLASRNRFFLVIRADDPEFDREATRAFLEGLKPLAAQEVPE